LAFSGESNLNVSFVVLFTVLLPFCQLPFKTNTNLNIISKTVKENKEALLDKKGHRCVNTEYVMSEVKRRIAAGTFSKRRPFVIEIKHKFLLCCERL
jgi:hypothetical protein